MGNTHNRESFPCALSLHWWVPEVDMFLLFNRTVSETVLLSTHTSAVEKSSQLNPGVRLKEPNSNRPACKCT